MFHIKNNVAVIALNNPPINSLGYVQLSHILQMMELAQVNDDVKGIVLVGNSKAFSAGADISEFGTEFQFHEPILRSVVSAIQNSKKPVVAAVAGVALGGGLELALACHLRVALSSARVGFPEINLGLIPGSSGTQLLPRVVGVDAALSMLISGQTLASSDPLCNGLFSKIVEDDLEAEAIHQALQASEALNLLVEKIQLPLNSSEVEERVELRRSKLSARQRLQPAYASILDAVSACKLPLSDGLRVERALFLMLLSSQPALALRHLFKSERAASHLPSSFSSRLREVNKIAVIGAGTMGSGIAIAALNSGFHVLLLEQDSEALDRGCERIRSHYRERVQSGKLKATQAAKNESQLKMSTDWATLGDVDLVIEAVFEDIAVKHEVFKKIDQHARKGAVLATNTSYLDIDSIADATQRPQDVVGLHFFSPANVMKLLEVVQGAKTSAEVLATAMSLGTRLKKTPVLCGNAFGFIGNRIYNAYRRQCEFMLEDGAWPEEVDKALTDMGFAMGPFSVADLSGLDIAWRMRKSQAGKRDPRERYVSILDSLCELGRLGRKTGAGYFVYSDGKQSSGSDEIVRQLIEKASQDRGIQRRALSPAEIQRRVLLAMVNEAALLLSEGVAKRPEDIDVVLTQGYGFPRWEGGPVFWARHQDREELNADLVQLANDAGYGYELCNLEILL